MISFARIARRHFRNPALRVVNDRGIQVLVADRPVALFSAEGAAVERFVKHVAVDRFCAEVISAGTGLHTSQGQDEPTDILVQSDDHFDRPGW